MRMVESAKSEKNKKIYLLTSPVLIDFRPPRHFAISTKNRRFTGNTEGQLFFPTPVSGPNPAVWKSEYRKERAKKPVSSRNNPLAETLIDWMKVKNMNKLNISNSAAKFPAVTNLTITDEAFY